MIGRKRINKYKSCLKDSYGYGGIKDCKEYLTDRYGIIPELQEEQVLLMDSFKMSEFEAGMPNCVLTAITRILCYYGKLGNCSIDEDKKDIYEKIRQLLFNNEYSSKKGVGFHRITHVVKKSAKLFSILEIRVHAVYLLGVFYGIKKEIEMKRPALLNISFGYYENHTVTACGYCIYKLPKKIGPVKYKKKYRFVAVHDGWNFPVMYIDYERFHVPASINKIKI